MKTGDVLSVNSGGPDMTVREVRADGVVCDWFDGKEDRQKVFPADMLREGSEASRQLETLRLLNEQKAKDEAAERRRRRPGIFNM